MRQTTFTMNITTNDIIKSEISMKIKIESGRDPKIETYTLDKVFATPVIGLVLMLILLIILLLSIPIQLICCCFCNANVNYEYKISSDRKTFFYYLKGFIFMLVQHIFFIHTIRYIFDMRYRCWSNDVLYEYLLVLGKCKSLSCCLSYV